MNEKELKRISKFLSYVLRHQPDSIGISLNEQGWTSTTTLLEQMSLQGKKVNLEGLKEVVEKNNKQRFSFNEDLSMIRANQGHSVSLDLGYSAIEPPGVLYHGTATRFIDSIQKTGLEKRNRHHVHLSAETATAKNVGQRHGKVIILDVHAKEMHEAGYKFFISENGVWLTDHVPTDYIDFP